MIIWDDRNLTNFPVGIKTNKSYGMVLTLAYSMVENLYYGSGFASPRRLAVTLL